MAMTLRLTEEEDQMLQALAAAQGISKQEAVVRAIRNALERRQAARDDLLKRIVKEDAPLLDLLAK
jgi:hypothetical protein